MGRQAPVVKQDDPYMDISRVYEMRKEASSSSPNARTLPSHARNIGAGAILRNPFSESCCLTDFLLLVICGLEYLSEICS